MNDIDIKSYRDFKRLISGHTSQSLHAFYDDVYYQKHVGSKEIAGAFFAGKGLEETPKTRVALRIAAMKPGERVLDIGCGRGELAFQAAARGAEVTGIDFSESAIAIANSTLAQHEEPIRSRVRFMCVDAGKLDIPDSSIDCVFLIDVVEHISAHEMDAVLSESARILKPGGRMVIYTPNVWTRTWGYGIRNIVSILSRGRRLPHPIVSQFRALQDDPEFDAHKIILHINEQSVHGLKRALQRNGFKSSVWIEQTGNKWFGRSDLMGRLVSGVYRALRLKYVFGPDIAASAVVRKQT